eukprot:GHVR01024828.1.p1 GENE.GHVR01024828.1~~GHVR01024828.1.p1  ORF type:complete len:123 (+),score=18.11 GHVR01024828.1:227-595(+)
MRPGIYCGPLHAGACHILEHSADTTSHALYIVHPCRLRPLPLPPIYSTSEIDLVQTPLSPTVEDYLITTSSPLVLATPRGVIPDNDTAEGARGPQQQREVEEVRTEQVTLEEQHQSRDAPAF